MTPTDGEITGDARRALDRARSSRDPRFDGKFFIAVTSTRIYCRPVCPVPPPRVANIRYYATAAAAAEAGYRPCLRCRPEAAPGTPAWLGASAVVRRALQLIQDGALDAASVDALAARVGIGPRHLHRLFVQHVGAPPVTVAQTRRLGFAKRLLDETRLPIAQIAVASGFGSARRFNDAFLKTYRRPPREVRRSLGRAGADAAVTLTLAYRPPYDWAHVLSFLATRAIPGVERVDANGYARTVTTAAGPAFIEVAPLPGVHALRLTVRGATPSALFPIVAAARRMFDLTADPPLVADTFRGDPRLGPLVRARPGLRIPGAWDPFECAVRAVLGQQVTVAAGRTLAIRLVSRLGGAVDGGSADGLTHLFPGPQALASASLDGLGLTGARAKTLRALGRAVAHGDVDFAAPVADVTAALESLPGIGAWTAQYVAFRALGETDAFPAADLVLRQVAGRPGSPLSARELESRSQSWRPWRSYAVVYLWNAAGGAAAPRSPRKPAAGRRSRAGARARAVPSLPE